MNFPTTVCDATRLLSWEKKLARRKMHDKYRNTEIKDSIKYIVEVGEGDNNYAYEVTATQLYHLYSDIEYVGDYHIMTLVCEFLNGKWIKRAMYPHMLRFHH